jgi:uncharacterized protein (TIGR00730 family)
VSDDNYNSFPAPDGEFESTPAELGDVVERLRHASTHLPKERTSHHDLKLLSRAIRELRRAFSVFEPYRDQRKVTIFGSARTPRDAPAYLQAEALGRAMVESGWFVVTGAATGIMEAGHRGAGRDHSMGLNILLPFEQQSNEIIRGDAKLVTMKYFFTRKLMFVKECDAVVCLPGGFGTLDEAFEVLTLMQTGKCELMPFVLLDAPGGNFWSHLLAYIENNLLAEGMISADDLSLIYVTDRVNEAVANVERFYRVYHSMQYIRGRLMFRLRRAPSEQQLATLDGEFGDILSEGRFELLSDAPPGEPDDPEIAHLARLAFHFNRRNHGRLRKLVDWINAEIS